MKLTSLGFALAALLLGTGCGRTELDLQAEDTEGQPGASSMAGSGGWTTAWGPGGGSSAGSSVGGQAGNPGGQSSVIAVAGSTFIQPLASAGAGAIASRSSSQGGRSGSTALPPPGGTRPPLAGNLGGSITSIPRTTGGVRGGTITSMGGRVAGFTATASRGGAMGGVLTTSSRGGIPNGTSATTGQGGTSGGAVAVGGSGGSSSSCLGLDWTEDLIDDMNDGNRYIPTNSGRAGSWNVSHDASPDGTMFPATSREFVMSDTGDPCRKKAVYAYGSLFVDWGANVWVSLGSPYDASKYRGISFWAKIDGGTSPTLRVAFPDRDTQPEGALCTTSVSSGPTACFDHYGKQLYLTTAWTKYTVLFSELSQGHWGRQGSAIDPTTLFEILFQISDSAKFGLWIDDVSFVIPASNGLY